MERNTHDGKTSLSKKRKAEAFHPTTLSDWIDLVAKVGAIIAGIFAVYQYIEAQKSERIKATLEYVKRFNLPDDNVSKSVRRLSSALNANSNNILRFQNATLTKEQAQAIRKRLTTQIVSEASAEDDVIREIDDFFDTLRICVESNICDQQTAVEFFHSYASSFEENFESVLQERAVMSPGFGRGTLWMSKAGAKQ